MMQVLLMLLVNPVVLLLGHVNVCFKKGLSASVVSLLLE